MGSDSAQRGCCVVQGGGGSCRADSIPLGDELLFPYSVILLCMSCLVSCQSSSLEIKEEGMTLTLKVKRRRWPLTIPPKV